MSRLSILTSRSAAIGMASAALLAGSAMLAPPAQAALPTGCSESGSTVTCSYAFTGAEQKFTVPSGVSAVHVEAVGAPGSASAPIPQTYTNSGGSGAIADAELFVSPRETLYVEVGGPGRIDPGRWNGGWNGGGNSAYGDGAGGGGASDVRLCSMTATSCPAGGGTPGPHPNPVEAGRTHTTALAAAPAPRPPGGPAGPRESLNSTDRSASAARKEPAATAYLPRPRGEGPVAAAAAGTVAPAAAPAA
jgi:hypothetical protein